jgi:quercetin dioxygenase-like cupin family protein
MVLHDEANVRIIAFRLLPGQTIPPHLSPSTVTVLVTEGSGTFHGENGEVVLRVGEGAVYAPNEMHSITAGEEPLRSLALISPRPGG